MFSIQHFKYESLIGKFQWRIFFQSQVWECSIFLLSLYYHFLLQASQITFICPMIFNYFPLDTQVRLDTTLARVDFLHKTVQVCKFQVGSYSYNMEKMIFNVSQLGYAHTSRYKIWLQNEKYFTFEMLKSLYDLNQGQRSR